MIRFISAQVARFVGHRQARQRTPSKLSERRPPQHNQNIQRYVPNEKLDVELDNLFQMTSNSKLQVITESKQCQTTAEDAQWEWQQVWKGAFERLKRELQDKDSELQTMTIELKELRALVAAQKHALELQDRVHDDANTKNRAEIDNMRAVHALEIEDLKTKQKKQVWHHWGSQRMLLNESWFQLQQMALQNEQILRQRRRDKEVCMSLFFLHYSTLCHARWMVHSICNLTNMGIFLRTLMIFTLIHYV